MPASALWAAGMRTLPPVSVPMPTVAKLAAMEAPVPPEEPPVANAVLYGLRAKPGSTELMLSPPPLVNSEVEALPRMMPPAALIFATRVASRFGIQFFQP